jgi:hypothetical protein
LTGGTWDQDWFQPLTHSLDAPVFLPYPDYPGAQDWAEPIKKAYGFSAVW